MDIDTYETYLNRQVDRGNLSPDTRRAYLGAMKRYADWLGRPYIGDAPVDSFKDYCLAAAAGKTGDVALEGASLNVAKCAYRKVLHRAGRGDDYDDLQFWFSENFRVSASGEPDHFTPTEMNAIREAAADEPRHAAVVAVLSATGCRVGEVIRLDRDDVTFDPPFEAEEYVAGVRIQRQKRGKPVSDIRPLDAEAAEAIDTYIDTMAEYVPTDAVASDALFPTWSRTSVDSPHLPSGIEPDGTNPELGDYTWRATDDSVNGWLKTVARNTDHPDVTEERMHAHLFRHTVGTRLGEEGYSAEKIGAFLGRASGAGEYVHLEDSEAVMDMASVAP